MYPSPFCNLSRRHWMGGGVQVGCGAGGAPTGRRAAPTAGGAGWRPVPTEPRRTRKPPASLPGTLGDGPTGQTPPRNPPPDSGALCARPLPSSRAGAGGGLRRVVIQLSASGLYVDLKRSLIVVHLGQNPFQLVGCRQHGLVLAGKYLLVVREQHHLHHRVVLVLAEQYAYDRVLVN